MHVCLLQGPVISLAGGLGGVGLCLIHYLCPQRTKHNSFHIGAASQEKRSGRKEGKRNSHAVVSEIAVFWLPGLRLLFFECLLKPL